MPTRTGYKSAYQPLPDFASTLFKGQQLQLQRERLDAATQPKPTKLDKLSGGWTPHTPALQQAANEIIKLRSEAINSRDSKGQAEADAKWRTLIAASNDSKNMGTRYGHTETAMRNKYNDFTQESITAFEDFAGKHGQQLTTDGKGNLVFGGQQIYKDGFNPFIKMPSVKGVDESVFEQGLKLFGQGAQFYSAAGDYTRTDENKLRSDLIEFSQIMGESNASPEVIQRGTQALYTHYYKDPQKRWKDEAAKDKGDGDKGLLYKIRKTTTELPSAGQDIKADRLTISYPHKGSQPQVSMMFKDIDSGKKQSNRVTINNITKVAEGKYIAEGDGYEMSDVKDEEGNIISSKVVGKRNIKFEIDSDNRATIEDTYLDGESLESVFEEKDSKKAITDEVTLEGEAKQAYDYYRENGLKGVDTKALYKKYPELKGRL